MLFATGLGCGTSDPSLTGGTAGDASQRARGPLPPPRRRGMWVLCQGSQRVLEHPERLAALFADAEALGVTDLFVQVYRGGRAWFASSFADAGPSQQVWRNERGDALAVLIADAHARGIKVHAWVNVLSLASNRRAPLIERVPGSVHVDQHGRSVLDYPKLDVPEPEAGLYRMGTPAVWIDPAAPGVADELATTFAELVALYPQLDGLHLDYIRYPDVLPFSPGTRFGVGLSFGHGEATRERFRIETGVTAPVGRSLGNGNRFDDWRREKLSELVGRIRSEARQHAPRLELSAAVWAWPNRAYLSIFQDWRGWLDEGLVEFVVPMLYTLDDRLLRYGTEDFAGLPTARRIWVGLGSWLFAKDPQRAVAQLATVEDHAPLGSALFSWDSIHSTPALRDALAAAVAGERGGSAAAAAVEREATAPAAIAP